jgi:hypothetical protein
MLVVSIVFMLLLLFLSFSITPYKVRSYDETKAECTRPTPGSSTATASRCRASASTGRAADGSGTELDRVQVSVRSMR